MVKTIEELLDMCAKDGGQIVSTAKLRVDEIESARQTNRMYVDQNGLGFVWEPENPCLWFRFPSTIDEVAALEEYINKYYPVPPQMPESLSPENFMKRLYKE